MKKFIQLLLLTCVFVSGGSAQEVYHFTKGLAVTSAARYGREAVYIDDLAYQLYTKSLKTPAEGREFGVDDKKVPLLWQAVVADSANRLILRGQNRNPGFGRSGYIYLTYTAEKEKAALLNINGNSAVFINGELHTGDPYRTGWLHIPVNLKKGLNEFYVRGLFITANLSFLQKPVLIKIEDATLPTIVSSEDNKSLQAAVVVINTSSNPLNGLQVKSNLSGQEIKTSLPVIPAMSIRKVSFQFDGSKVISAGKNNCFIELLDKGRTLDTATLVIESISSGNKYSVTFTSKIDGSLQYYAVAPQANGTKPNAALFFSVHGAGVEAIGQARAYQSKDWGTLVAPTNRRPRGFNWEDWGRLDALEVLDLAREKFKPDPQRIYLTGHSMGGHGTWFLGVTYPDKWAAIAPCAGYPTLKGYGSADGLIPDSSDVPIEKMLLRSSNQSDVPKLANNYRSLGVYIFHGDADPVVSVNYARQMRKLLGEFHTDMSYYEYPGGNHWFGDQSVDWKPIFDFFKWHSSPTDTSVNTIDFTTASPGISASNHWASIHQQFYPLQYSRLQLKRNKVEKTISGITSNVKLLKLHLKDFSSGASVKITLDNQTVQYTLQGLRDSVFLSNENDKWVIAEAPDLYQKGPHRYGTLKDAFNHKMVYVYGTAGSKEENEWSYNKARYDAETWYYRGNGAVDIIADHQFSLSKYKDRGIILIGNKTTNKAWELLLDDCPIQVERNKVTAGNKAWAGDDLGAYLVWPIKNSSIASVAVISGTGLKGMKAADANQYFAGASGFPDFMIFSLDMLRSGIGGVKMAGFFDSHWKLSQSNLVRSE